LAVGSFSVLVQIPEPVEASSHWTPRDPIYIWGNAGFTAENGTTGGSGTPEDPYIIEGWEIDAPGSDSGIYIAVTDAHFIIRDVYVHNAGSSGILLWDVTNGRIEDSRVATSNIGIYLASSMNITLARNAVFLNEQLGIWVSGGSKILLSTNSISDNLQGASIKATEVTITDNTLSSNSDIGLSVGGSYVAVADNNISGNAGTGMAASLSDSTVKGNVFSSNGGEGLALYSVYRTTVSENTATENRVGILVRGSYSETTVSDNVASSNSAYGIEVTQDLSGSVERNVVSANGKYGIYAHDAWTSGAPDEGIFSENVISGNADYGLRAEDAFGLAVYHNDFLGNAAQAYDNQANLWDDGYPSGGNYWSDYTGVDKCKGPNQYDCTGPDGIGDAPYEIDDDSKDRYPLVEPFVAANTPPVASFTFSPATPTVGDTVTFDASGSADPDGTIVLYEWDLGDGTSDGVTSPMITHAYATEGSYTVVLTVIDNGGLSDTAAKLIEVFTSSTEATVVLERIDLFKIDGVTFWAEAVEVPVSLSVTADSIPASIPVSKTTFYANALELGYFLFGLDVAVTKAAGGEQDTLPGGGTASRGDYLLAGTVVLGIRVNGLPERTSSFSFMVDLSLRYENIKYPLEVAQWGAEIVLQVLAGVRPTLVLAFLPDFFCSLLQSPLLSDSNPCAPAVVTVWSPVNLLVRSPSGTLIGTTAEGIQVNDLVDAWYSGPDVEPQIVWMSRPERGDFQVTLVATGSGKATYAIGVFTKTGLLVEEFSLSVEKGMVYQASFALADEDFTATRPEPMVALDIFSGISPLLVAGTIAVAVALVAVVLLRPRRRSD
jgi:parallel beta-helix repeat protein